MCTSTKMTLKTDLAFHIKHFYSMTRHTDFTSLSLLLVSILSFELYTYLLLLLSLLLLFVALVFLLFDFLLPLFILCLMRSEKREYVCGDENGGRFVSIKMVFEIHHCVLPTYVDVCKQFHLTGSIL